ncbi:histidine--tRNA ligase [Lignipirellula cremea]|uniref:Histidine--tRNA ligase n=1 Tax=Lignipirellula cremea TaxID=2528010 RepID=A0A518DWB6_9BACT|nr:histidine--tRNA ligase [Lignipirellula cremea]QDU96123.1 Histidine--tRNA ligase [Lignipirellula cremea]
MSELVKATAISGFPEWLPNMRLVEEQFIDTIRRQYQLYGFTPIETAAVERLEVLLAKGEMQRQIYTVGKPEEGAERDDDKNALGLHFDLTVPLARYVAQHSEKLMFPFRRYQIQKVWRGERAQRGRYREFYQCDIDIVGRTSLDLIHDAEMPCVINSVFSKLPVPEFRVRVSNRRILSGLIEGSGLAPSQYESVLRAVDKSQHAGLEKTEAELVKEQVDASVIPAILELIQAKTMDAARQIFAKANAPVAGLDELDQVLENAVALGMPEHRLEVDFSIARGLDYYTGTIYETFIEGYEQMGSVCSGGRYDDLTSFFTKQKFPGVGVSIGLSRLLAVALEAGTVTADKHTPTQVLVTAQDRQRFLKEYLGFAKLLREAGIPTEVYHESKGLGQQFGYAATAGVRFAVIAGEQEIADKTVAVKDLSDRSQETIPRSELAGYLLAKLQA